MKNLLFVLKTSVGCLLAIYLFFFNISTVAKAVETDESQQMSGSTVALIEISSYEIAEGVIEAGRDVKVNVNLHNASTTTNAHNVIVTVSSSSGMVYPTYGNDNQVYVGTIGPNKTSTATIPVTISPDFSGNAIDLTCTMVFESRGTRLSNVATVVLPTSNGSALAIKSIDVSPKATVYGKSLLSVNYINNSADTINDGKLIITGNVDADSKEIDLGTISAGKSYLKDFYITFVETGAQGIQISLTYSNANGEIINTDLGTYNVNVEAEGAAAVDNTPDNTNMLWIGRGVSIAAIIAALIVIIVYIRKR